MTEDLAPQDYYKEARKVDWLIINSYNAQTGKKGEELVFNLEKHYLKTIHGDNLAESVCYKEDGSGYDILSYFSDGRKKYIEVKTTINGLESPYILSRDEAEFLAEHKDNAFLYRVALGDTNTPPRLKVYTFKDVAKAKSRARSFTITH